MKFLYVIGMGVLCIACSTQTNKIISNPKDYFHYIQANVPQPIQVSLDSEIIFWQKKLSEIPNGFLYQQKLGTALAHQFELTGDIDLIHQSNELFTTASTSTKGKARAATLLSLSSNAIKLHQFKKALTFALEAERNTDEVYGPKMMQYDALMELGKYDNAIQILKSSQRPETYGYQVRYAKYQDHIGHLDSAIYYMETALNLVRHDESQWLWTLASLGDYYGHSGQIEKSYQTYLKILEIEPRYAHALQGIAWIAYSNDGDAPAAISILEYLDAQKVMPDQKLRMAELYHFLGQTSVAHTLTDQFVKEAILPQYGDMYNTYLIDYYVEHDLDRALILAQREIDNRPTVQSYTALAWVQYHTGHFDKAMNTLKMHVLDKTFEPKLLYKAALISAASGEHRIAKILLTGCIEAKFELGPEVIGKIEATF